MDNLREFYIRGPPTFEREPDHSSILFSDQRYNPNEFAHDALNPAIYHKFAGYYPENTLRRPHIHTLEQHPTVIFQHAPQFSFFPEHSNLDVDLNW